MNVQPTTLGGVFLVHTDKLADERGYFARAHCAEVFAAAGLPERFVQSNLSFNRQAGTFRGLHFQVPPSKEGKLVRCVAGSIFDVVVDLRPDSASFLQHEWFTLSASNLDALYMPPGFAHGFVTDADDTLVHYEMTDFYAPGLSRGLRWSDPAFGISLPRPIAVINDRDAAYASVDVADLDIFRESKEG